jgi:hypothetical protein
VSRPSLGIRSLGNVSPLLKPVALPRAFHWPDTEPYPSEPVRKLGGVLFSRKRPDGDPTSHSSFSVLSPQKPCGRRVFCRWPALARPLQPTAGMRRPRRLGHHQNPSPQDPSKFSDGLSGVTLPSERGAHAPPPSALGVWSLHQPVRSYAHAPLKISRIVPPQALSRRSSASCPVIPG